jgi:isocitrate/isopropylmalate dehydrogenase
MKIAVAKGDGIGPEIMEAVIHVFNAANISLWIWVNGFLTKVLVMV